MLFVPLPLFAVMLLVLILIRFAAQRDMSVRAHQLFFLLVAVYAVQSFLITLRWGYGVDAVAPLVGALAPLLPVMAYLSYRALTARLTLVSLWPLLCVWVTWGALAWARDFADAVILVTYLGFGGLLLALARRGPDALSFAPLVHTGETLRAMTVTGAVLVASGLTDIYLIADFVLNEGRNAGAVVTLVQTGFVLCVGFAASIVKSAGSDAMAEGAAPQQNEAAVSEGQAPATAQAEDEALLARIDTLFRTERLYQDDDLSLRRLARRIGLPDRRVSQAINRARGVSVSQFVNTYRIEEACHRLKTTEDSILAVSLGAGFATKSNFNREFQRVTGTSPSAWRKAQKAAAEG